MKVSIGVCAGYWHGAKAKGKIKRDFQTLADLHPHWEVAADPDCVESHHQGGDKLDHLVIVLVTAVILILGVLNLKMGRLVHWKDIIVTWFYWFCDKYSPVILSDTSSTTGTAWLILVQITSHIDVIHIIHTNVLDFIFMIAIQKTLAPDALPQSGKSVVRVHDHMDTAVEESTLIMWDYISRD